MTLYVALQGGVVGAVLGASVSAKRMEAIPHADADTSRPSGTLRRGIVLGSQLGFVFGWALSEAMYVSYRVRPTGTAPELEVMKFLAYILAPYVMIWTIFGLLSSASEPSGRHAGS